MTKPNISVFWTTVFLIVLGVGIYLRLHSYEKIQGVGFDENIYRHYVEKIDKVGWLRYPEIVNSYIEEQKAAPIAFLPPTRLSFLLSAAIWQGVSGLSSLESVRAVSCAATIVLLLGAAAFSYRLGGSRVALVVTALMSFAPLQLYMSHRALIDGFFAAVTFFVIWFLWEVLQNPTKKRWLIGYGSALALMVLTKENAAFVYIALLAILAGNHWLKLGDVTKSLWVVTLFAPMLGGGLLILAAGGLDPLFTAYLLNVKMSYHLPYAIMTGDGPWFRYLSDLILTIPIIIILALGGIFREFATNRAARFFTVFVLATYIIMGNLRYGMNLRYALIWDFPLVYLASIPLLAVTSVSPKPALRDTLLTFSVIVVIYFQMHNYLNIFVRNEVYDPVPQSLMRALDMIK